ncbi:type II secretion system minor pseudopilin GspH [Pseudomarimonas arenosa]|uniref:Type II secretion system protein H n=1 Tax=Pseudomarimonas arenosa TaxID=2774145 RepID=A0AAW3ZJD8_9GAMM|nr:type II secretion system minor pseudopilin GspH [Pseudomarimonas arenosa]MBD8525560.1 type II secretion system minor pseudopilin GspH [Pseudomarimonas arenosa]
MLRHTRGFSLIELLVVMVIVGVVLGAVVLRMSSGSERAVEDAARRSQALILLACERAAVTGVDIGFSLIDGRWLFGYQRPQGWQPMADQPSEELRPRDLGEALRLELRRDGRALESEPASEQEAQRPQLLCLSSGELSPFELRIGAAGQEFAWRLTGRLDGRVAMEPFDAP